MRMNDRRNKMSSVKRKLTNKTSVQKCEIIRQIEKGMTNKEASERYLPLCNAFNSYKKLIVHHITTYIFFSFSFYEIYELYIL